MSALFQIGNAVGFLIPPAIVQDSEDLDAIGHDLSIMFYGQAVITSVLFVIIVLGGCQLSACCRTLKME